MTVTVIGILWVFILPLGLCAWLQDGTGGRNA